MVSLFPSKLLGLVLGYFPYISSSPYYSYYYITKSQHTQTRWQHVSKSKHAQLLFCFLLSASFTPHIREKRWELVISRRAGTCDITLHE